MSRAITRAARQKGAPPWPEAPVLGPSGLDLDGKPHGRTMTLAEIDETIDAFARSARLAQQAGFDGVEIHGAHGYLVDQFLWDRTNRREDDWGGSLAARSRFAAGIVAAIRRAVGPDYPVILRFSQWKGGHYDARPWATPDELRAALQPMVDAGLSAFHVSTRRYHEPGFEGSPLTLAGWTRQLFGLPVIAVGSVGLQAPYIRGAAAPAESTGIGTVPALMAAGEFDLIAIGRALLGDPRWVAKLRDPREGPQLGYDPEFQKTLI